MRTRVAATLERASSRECARNNENQGARTRFLHPRGATFFRSRPVRVSVSRPSAARHDGRPPPALTCAGTRGAGGLQPCRCRSRLCRSAEEPSSSCCSSGARCGKVPPRPRI